MSESSPPGGDDAPDSVPIPLSRRSQPKIAVDEDEKAPTPRERPTKVPSDAPPPMGGVRWASRAASTTRWIGAASTVVFAFLVFVAIFADMFASDLPIACKVDGRIHLFPNVTGRVVDAARAEWKIGALVPHGPSSPSGVVLARPGASRGHPFGTDRSGRDVFARVVHGTRAYLVFAFAAIAASIALGAVLGALAGLFGGPTDAFVSRAVESIAAFPPLVLVLGVQAAVPKPTLLTLFLAIALTRWPEIARLVRGEVIFAQTRDYALAARALGASPLRVLFRHIAPNVMGRLIVAATLGASAVVLTEASLDFLRVGTPAGAASWGETMSEFRDAEGAWWLLAFPGVLVVSTVMALTLVGESIRARLDPRNR